MLRFTVFVSLVAVVCSSSAQAGGGLFSDDYGMHLIDHRYPDYFAKGAIAAAARGRVWYPAQQLDCDCDECRRTAPQPESIDPAVPETVVPAPVSTKRTSPQAVRRSSQQAAADIQSIQAKTYPDAAALFPRFPKRQNP